MPFGAFEQHGPHLPINTDCRIAEIFAESLIERYGQSHDLFLAPTMSIGFSHEHIPSSGTLSFSLNTVVGVLQEVATEISNSHGISKLVIVNGHGGNRGVLEAVIQEIRRKAEIIVCVFHPSALAEVSSESDYPEVHGGKSETSLMMHIAPDDVHLHELERSDWTPAGIDRESVRRQILTRGATWPWATSHQGLAAQGIVGNPSGATAELGRRIFEAALRNARKHLDDLRELSA